MLCDNIKPSLNIYSLVIDMVYTDIKITKKIKTNHLLRLLKLYFYWQSFYCKNNPIFSSYAQSYFFSLKMWKIISRSDSLEYTQSYTKKHAGGWYRLFLISEYQFWAHQFGRIQI